MIQSSPIIAGTLGNSAQACLALIISGELLLIVGMEQPVTTPPPDMHSPKILPEVPTHFDNPDY